MKSPETCKISYLGFSKPENPSELEVEILGLKNLIAKANERITSLEQSLKLAQIYIEEELNKKKESDR